MRDYARGEFDRYRHVTDLVSSLSTQREVRMGVLTILGPHSIPAFRTLGSAESALRSC